MDESMMAYNNALVMAEMSFAINDASGLVWAFQTLDAVEFILAEMNED